MRSQKEIEARMQQYVGAEIFYADYGYIVWQYTTGENVEILFIEAKEPGKGDGRRLMAEMVKQIDPYHSVFVVRRAINEQAGEFYRALGFKETVISGLYKDEDAVLGTIVYSELSKNTL